MSACITQRFQGFARVMIIVTMMGLVCAPAYCHAGQARVLSGTATLIRPEVSSLSVTDTQINAIFNTNIDLIAVGQIPVLATNIDYQIIFTNNGPVNIYYDTLILTNSPIVPGGPYVCTDLTITNITASETNVVLIGNTCILSNSLRTVSIVTNSIAAAFQYYILATTNLIFDAQDPRCWETVYQTNLTITSTINTNTLIADYNFTFVGSDTARGSVSLSQHDTAERFSVSGRDLLIDASSPPLALGVFIGTSMFDLDWRPVGIMSKAGTNNLYRLELNSANGAPPTLGVAHVSDLAGMLVQIRDQDTNVYAQAVIPPLVPVPAALSYRMQSRLQQPPVAPPSPKASGVIRVKYDGRTGASYLEIAVRGLAAGNVYCALYTPDANPDTGGCKDGLRLQNGRGFERFNTLKGEDLPFGIGDSIATVADLAGLHVYIVDAFGNIHLSGDIPGP